jgi:hypothetical protein
MVIKLQKLGKLKHDEYTKNSPFAHMSFTDLFDTAMLRQVHDEFPLMEAGMSCKTNRTTIKKFSYRTSGSARFGKEDVDVLEACGPHTKKFLTYLNSEEFLNFLEDLTGISNLVADDTYEGAGPCSIGTGGLLKMHIDFNVHPKNEKLHRRINVLVYLNEDWEDDWGGHLDLWGDVENDELKVRIPPNMNTTAIFNTTEDSWHGHPDPLNCPNDRRRRFISAYYYVKEPPGSREVHTTIYKK